MEEYFLWKNISQAKKKIMGGPYITCPIPRALRNKIFIKKKKKN